MSVVLKWREIKGDVPTPEPVLNTLHYNAPSHLVLSRYFSQNLARHRKLPPGWRAASCTGFFFFYCKISKSVFTEFWARVPDRQDSTWDDLMLQSPGEKEGSAVLGQRPKSCHLSEDASYRSQGRAESGSSLYWESFDKNISAMLPSRTLLQLTH